MPYCLLVWRNRPAHPALGGGVGSRPPELCPVVKAILDVVGEVASMAAVEEDLNRIHGLVAAPR